MKFAIFVFTITATAGAFAMPASDVWVRQIDASPEALLIGSSLLMIAAGLRHLLTPQAK